jgi:Regulator of chromosome condensation (RCC1) repeat
MVHYPSPSTRFFALALLAAGQASCERPSIVIAPVSTAPSQTATAAAVPLAATPWNVSAGGGSCAWREGADVWCWGWPFGGARPVRIAPLDGALSVTVFTLGVCGIVRPGHARCVGQLSAWLDGSHVVDESRSDVRDFVVPGAVQIAGSEAGVCAWGGEGAYCWGRNDYGQVGPHPDPSTDGAPVREPYRILAGPVRLVGVGTDTTCAESADGLTRCRGLDLYGQGGPDPCLAAPSVRCMPMGERRFPALDGASQVAVSMRSTCALRADGHVICTAGEGGCAPGGDVQAARLAAPAEVAGLDDVVAVSGAVVLTCALRSSGRVACWGIDGEQRGDGQPQFPRSVTRCDVSEVVDLTDATAISVGGFHACAVRASGGVVCWGTNNSRALGAEAPESSSRPLPVLYPPFVPQPPSPPCVHAGVFRCKEGDCAYDRPDVCR